MTTSSPQPGDGPRPAQHHVSPGHERPPIAQEPHPRAAPPPQPGAPQAPRATPKGSVVMLVIGIIVLVPVFGLIALRAVIAIVLSLQGSTDPAYALGYGVVGPLVVSALLWIPAVILVVLGIRGIRRARQR